MGEARKESRLAPDFAAKRLKKQTRALALRALR